MSVADRIKYFRKQRKLSQEQLEVKSGVSQSAISAIERGERQPTVETLSMLAAGLKVSLSDLVEEEIKEPAVDIGGLDEELIALLVSLPDRDVQRVKDFVSGLVASQEV